MCKNFSLSRTVFSVSVTIFFVAASAQGQPTADRAASRPSANPPSPDGEIEFSTLITAQDVTRHCSTPDDCRRAAARFRKLGIRRLWIESIRGGHRVAPEILRMARDVFREEGLIASGAVTTTWGPGFGAKSSAGFFLCYSAPETHRALAENAALTASVFDEIMYDDFLATDCRCPRCTQQKGDRTWAEFRCGLRSRIARQFIVEPAHRANPDVVAIIKYPQWYDKFHRLGYDVIRDTANFDAIWVGTETRGPDSPRFGFVPLFQSAVVYRWLDSIGREKTRGGWFDPYDCTPDEYVDQAYATVFAGATELMRFNAFAILSDGPHKPAMTLFATHRPHIEAIGKQLHGRSPLGLWAYKPPYSTPGDEEYFFDYFGTLGIPLNATAQFPKRAKNATLLLTRAARHDQAIDEQVVAWTANGGSVIATAGFLADASKSVLNIFGITSVRANGGDVSELFVKQRPVRCSTVISLGGFVETGRATVPIAAKVDENRVPLLTRAETPAGGFAACVNLRTAGGGDGIKELLMSRRIGWLDLPQPAVDVLREVALAETGLRLTAPTRVVAYPFSDNFLGLINVRETETRVRLHLSEPWFSSSIRRLTVYPKNESAEAGKDGSFDILLPPRARWWLLGAEK